MANMMQRKVPQGGEVQVTKSGQKAANLVQL